MREMDFSFEEAPWENWLRTMQMGDEVSAAQLLALLEEEPEDALEEALQELEMACMVLDVSGLPKNSGAGEAALRLRREAHMADDGSFLEELEENDPLRLYLEEIAAIPVRGDEVLLAKDAAGGDKNAMEKLANLGLCRVVELAREYVGFGVLLLDLIQEGSLGLWHAICNFHYGEYGPHRDKWIRFYMAKAVVLQARASGVGLKLKTALEDYRAVDERLLSDLGRNPTLAEIAAELHISAEETEVVRKMLENARLLQKVRPEQEAEEVPEEEDQAVENTALFQMRARITELLSVLSAEDQRLLILRYGLEGGSPLSAEDAGRKLGLTSDEVTMREAAALSRLRNK